MRLVFSSIDEIIDYIKDNSRFIGRQQTPYQVDIGNGEIRYTFASNTDQAIAAVAREKGFKIKSIPIFELMGK